MSSSRTVLLILIALLVQTGEGQTLPLPPRPDGSLSRSAIIQLITAMSRVDREETLFNIIMAGNVPEFLRVLTPVTSSSAINGTTHQATYFVTPEYLAVGPDAEYLLMPMTPLLAQRLADALGCSLPTRKMVNDIYAAAGVKLAPAPIPPSPAMTTVPLFVQHDTLVWSQRAPLLSSHPLGVLVGGTKKDVVISNKIRTDLKAGVPYPVVIYGWHQLDGTPIQPLYNGHGETYADYSHGIRLVHNAVLLDGGPTTIQDILRSTALASVLSDEGVISQPRYGDAPSDVGSDVGSAPRGGASLDSFPNPFNASTEIHYELASAATVTLKVFDMVGREAATLVNGPRGPGRYAVTLEGSGLASGVYVIRMTAGDMTRTRKLVLLR